MKPLDKIRRSKRIRRKLVLQEDNSIEYRAKENEGIQEGKKESLVQEILLAPSIHIIECVIGTSKDLQSNMEIEIEEVSPRQDPYILMKGLKRKYDNLGQWISRVKEASPSQIVYITRVEVEPIISTRVTIHRKE